jgi:hypothetical protein
MANVSEKSCCVVDGRASFRFVIFGAGDEGIRWTLGISAIRPVGAINADTALVLSDRPLDGIDDQPKDEVEKKLREVNVKALLLFLGEFGFHIVKVASDGWVIVVVISSF